MLPPREAALGVGEHAVRLPGREEPARGGGGTDPGRHRQPSLGRAAAAAEPACRVPAQVAGPRPSRPSGRLRPVQHLESWRPAAAAAAEGGGWRAAGWAASGRGAPRGAPSPLAEREAGSALLTASLEAELGPGPGQAGSQPSIPGGFLGSLRPPLLLHPVVTSHLGASRLGGRGRGAQGTSAGGVPGFPAALEEDALACPPLLRLPPPGTRAPGAQGAPLCSPRPHRERPARGSSTPPAARRHRCLIAPAAGEAAAAGDALYGALWLASSCPSPPWGGGGGEGVADFPTASGRRQSNGGRGQEGPLLFSLSPGQRWLLE